MARQATTDRRERIKTYVTDWMADAGEARNEKDKSGKE